MPSNNIRISVKTLSHDCQQVPLSTVVDNPPDGNLFLIDLNSGIQIPCQRETTGAEKTKITWIEPGIEKNSIKEYKLLASNTKSEFSQVLVKKSKEKIDVSIGESYLTSYYFGGSIHRPYFHPVIGPFGKSVTRAFPMEHVEGETDDHQHHRGIFSGNGAVNGVNNWTEGENCGYTDHKKFSKIESGSVFGHIVHHSNWTDPSKTKIVLEETREMKFFNIGSSRILDIDLYLHATKEDVFFEDDKEIGMISLRVATSMDIMSPEGVANSGRMENSAGGINEDEIWGKQAHWCDYSGVVDGKMVGVTLFDYDENYNHPVRWHARNYGLLTSNPFSTNCFNPELPKTGYNLKKGNSLIFKHRVYIHAGTTEEAKVVEKYQNYINPPLITIK